MSDPRVEAAGEALAGPATIIECQAVVLGTDIARQIADEVHAVFSRYLSSAQPVGLDEITAETRGVLASSIEGIAVTVDEAKVTAAVMVLRAVETEKPAEPESGFFPDVSESSTAQ